MANTGKRLKNLSYEDGTETTNENGIYTATLSGNYSGRPFVSVQATGANYNAFVKTVSDLISFTCWSDDADAEADRGPDRDPAPAAGHTPGQRHLCGRKYGSS